MDMMFTVEESNLICVFDGEDRNGIIEGIERALPHLDDPDMEELCHRVIGKLRNMTEEKFRQMHLTNAE